MTPIIFASEPCFIAFWLKPPHKRFHADFDHILATMAVIKNTLSIFNPPHRCKVCGLGTIEAMIESSVI
jgi:hypothetical protein